MKYIYLSSVFFPDSDFLKLSKGATSNANNAFQWAQIAGFSDNNLSDLYILTVPNIGAYPSKFKKIFIKEAFFYKYYKGVSVPFINLKGIKHVSIYFSLKQRLIECFSQNTGPITLIIYDLNPVFVKLATLVKKKYPKTKICFIVPDLPGNTGEAIESKRGIFTSIANSTLQNVASIGDYFVLLTIHMLDKLKVQSKPHVIIEGVFNSNDALNDKKLELPGISILYSGSLDERNGIMKLLGAFSLIKRSDYNLIICGDGNMKNQILELAQVDSRINYLGQISRAQILQLQISANVLVNPRTSEGEYTKYSFPSKTMEYLASGTPTLMYRLPGVPEEYFDYCLALEDESEFVLSESIVKICELEVDHYRSLANKAKTFIYSDKNPQTQMQKVMQLISRE